MTRFSEKLLSAEGLEASVIRREAYIGFERYWCSRVQTVILFLESFSLKYPSPLILTTTTAVQPLFGYYYP